MSCKQVITDSAKEGMRLLIRKRGEPIRKQIGKALKFLITDPRHPSLETHKLKRWDGWFEAKINRSDRLVFTQTGDQQIIAWCGDHEDLDRDAFKSAIIEAEEVFRKVVGDN